MALFAFGKAGFFGSAVDAMGAGRAAAAMVRTRSGRGYVILAVSGSIRVGFGGDVHGVGSVAALLPTAATR